MLDSTIHRINQYPADKYYGKRLSYLLGSDKYPVDSAIQLLNNWSQVFLGEHCGYYCWSTFVLWSGYFSASFQYFVSCHLVIKPIQNTKKLPKCTKSSSRTFHDFPGSALTLSLEKRTPFTNKTYENYE